MNEEMLKRLVDKLSQKVSELTHREIALQVQIEAMNEAGQKLVQDNEALKTQVASYEKEVQVANET